MKYLDETGLSHLWEKIKDYVDAHSGGGGGSTTPAIVSLGAKNTGTGTTQSINTSITKLNLGTTTTVLTDSSAFEITNGQIKCLRDGVVRVNASVYVKHGSSAGYQSLFLFKNGSENLSDVRYSTSNLFSTLSLQCIVEVNAGDYFDIRGRANTSSTFYTQNYATTLDVQFIG